MGLGAPDSSMISHFPRDHSLQPRLGTCVPSGGPRVTPPVHSPCESPRDDLKVEADPGTLYLKPDFMGDQPQTPMLAQGLEACLPGPPPLPRPPTQLPPQPSALSRLSCGAEACSSFPSPPQGAPRWPPPSIPLILSCSAGLFSLAAFILNHTRLLPCLFLPRRAETTCVLSPLYT